MRVGETFPFWGEVVAKGGRGGGGHAQPGYGYGLRKSGEKRRKGLIWLGRKGCDCGPGGRVRPAFGRTPMARDVPTSVVSFSFSWLFLPGVLPMAVNAAVAASSARSRAWGLCICGPCLPLPREIFP